MPKAWFSAKAAAGVGELAIFDDVTMDGATIVRDALAKMGNVRELRISINSAGGDISAGFAIFNMLKNHSARKVTRVEGIAASMASVIFMVGEERIMPTNTMLMIHNPWGMAAGDGDQLISFGEALIQMRDQIVTTYAAASGLDEPKIAALMDRETWMTADEALNLGFATTVTGAIKAAASFNLSRFKHPPKTLQDLAERAYGKPRLIKRAKSWDDVTKRAYDNWNKPRLRVVDGGQT